VTRSTGGKGVHVSGHMEAIVLEGSSPSVGHLGKKKMSSSISTRSLLFFWGLGLGREESFSSLKNGGLPRLRRRKRGGFRQGGANPIKKKARRQRGPKERFGTKKKAASTGTKMKKKKDEKARPESCPFHSKGGGERIRMDRMGIPTMKEERKPFLEVP